MILELITAILLGALVLWMALGSLGAPATGEDLADADPVEETPRGRALLAIKELEFDQATGKVSDEDFVTIRGRLVSEAMQVLDQTHPGVPDTRPVATACRKCGPRPEADARYCSACGLPVAA